MPETEDKPDLDELLELLGAPDEAPRRKRIPGSVWLMLALVLSFAGIWLAFRTAMGTAASRIAGPPVLPTKVSDRPAPERESPIADVVEDYLERCRKGMTAREVRWIVEDFQKAGLDEGLRSAPPEALFRQRMDQQAWYLDLLADGLGLNPEQKQTARGNLLVLLDRAVEEFHQGPGKGEPREGLGSFSEEGTAVRELIDPKRWLVDERYAPWNLCVLSDEQKRVTWHGWLQHHDKRVNEAFGADWIDPKAGAIRNSLVGDPEASAEFEMSDHIPDELYGAGAIFPLVVEQRFNREGMEMPGALDEQAMGCHPAQLKTSLLLNPIVAERVLQSLDSNEE